MHDANAEWPSSHAAIPAVRLRPGAPAKHGAQIVAEEVAIAIAYQGVGYAVMMGSPSDLDDFAVGFSLTERIAAEIGDVRGVVASAGPDGVRLDITLAPESLRAYLAAGRARVRPGHAGCGVCGSSDLVALGPPRPVPAGTLVTPGAIAIAFAALDDAQTINRATHATHAAGWAAPDGRLLLAREDVGRHNALDKLIGAGLRAAVDFANGFCVITSRCSVEMAQKAAIAGMPVLAAISGPTGMAVRHAEQSGLTLVGFARGKSMSVYAGARRLLLD